VGFTIPYKMFNQSQKLWVFSGKELTWRFENLIQQIRRESG